MSFPVRRHADGRADRERVDGRARPLHRRDDRDPRRDPRRSRTARWPRDDNPLKHAPHTAASAAGADEWTHAYSRERGGLSRWPALRAGEVLAAGRPRRQRLRRPQPVLLVPAARRLRGLTAATRHVRWNGLCVRPRHRNRRTGAAMPDTAESSTVFSTSSRPTRPGAATACAISSSTGTSASRRPPPAGCIAQLVKANKAPEKGTGWHRHEARVPHRAHAEGLGALHVRGQGDAGRGRRLRAPAARHRPLPVRLLARHGVPRGRRPGRLQRRSTCRRPCAVPDPSPVAPTRQAACDRPRPQNSMSSSSISSGSRLAAAIHSFISGIAMIVCAVGGARPVELDVVGEEARDHRRVHRVGHRRAACRTGTARRRSRGTRVQISTMRSMSGCAPRPDLVARVVRLQVHRQRRAQVGEARVHLAADRAAVRARDAVGRQQPAPRA